MDWFFYISIFIGGCYLLYVSGEIIIKSLLRISHLLGLKEFVVAFFVMAISASLPNFFVGVTSAIDQVPELSLGDILGNNLIALTLAVAIALFFAKDNEIPAESETIQTTSIFTIVSSILPIILISDGVLGMGDGFILIGLFVFYMFWLFSKKERFEKIYNEGEDVLVKDFKIFLFDSSKILGALLMLILSAQGVVFSAEFLALKLNLPIMIVGMLVVGFGSALPEIYFSVSSAIKNQSSMIMGNLMGSVIVPASLVLGLVAIIKPIYTDGMELFLISRAFLVLSAIFFFFFTKTERKITKREGVFLFFIYLSFALTIFIAGSN